MNARPILALLAMILPLAGGCGGEEAAPEPVLRPVRYVEAFSASGARARTFSGVARSGLESNLSFKVAGTVERVAVAPGDSVRSGQLIAQLDASDYRLQQQDAQAALTRAQAQERNARANYDRVQALYENNNASRTDLDAARTAHESAQAATRSAEARVELAGSQVADTRLVAPIAGAISAVAIETNENVRAGQVIAVLAAGSRMEVELGVPEALISRVTMGSPVTVTFDALPDRLFDGRVTEIGITTSDRLNTFPVTARLDAPDPSIRAGMAAEIRLSFESVSDDPRFFLPASAVGEDREGRFIFVIDRTADDRGTVRRTPVEVGELTTDGIEILNGLTDGDLVVTAGVSRIQNGQEVRVPADGS